MVSCNDFLIVSLTSDTLSTLSRFLFRIVVIFFFFSMGTVGGGVGLEMALFSSIISDPSFSVSLLSPVPST